MVMMGDQQVSSSVDLPSGVSPFYPIDQPLVGKVDVGEGDGWMSSAAGRGSSPLMMTTPSPRSSSSTATQAPVKPGGGGGGGDQSSPASSSSSSDVALRSTTTGDVIGEVNVNSAITSFGLMQVDAGNRYHHRQQQQQLNSSNTQNLSPSIYQLLAQSQHPMHRWPMTGIHKQQQQQQQQNAVSNFCPTTFHSDSQFSSNLSAGLGWNSNFQPKLLSHCSDFNTLWGQNQQFRNTSSLLSNSADMTLLSKLQPNTSFAKNFQQSTSVPNGKSVPEESNDCMNQLNHDAELLKLNSIDVSILEMSGLSQSQDHLKGFPNWTFTGQLATKRDQVVPNLSQLSGVSPHSLSPLRMEHYSRKVFVGGLPPDIDEEEITAAFRRFGPLIVDWPHKAESKSYFPPKGYCFLLFQDELSVQTLIDACIGEDGKLFWLVSSPTMKDKMVQIRPWNLADSDFVMDGSQPLDPRKTIFVGGVPRPLRAFELAVIMERLYGGVCYAGIDTDPELKYPKGAGRVAFSSQQSYIAAISARFVQLQHGEIDKRVEVKPYVLDDQLCDECQGIHCAGRFAPFFCANVTCLQYYCERCWSHIHSRPGREFHKPLVKEGADRPRSLPFRWC